MKKTGAKGADAILGGGTSADMFAKLLQGIHKSKNGDMVSAILTDAPVQLKGVDINLGPIMELLPAEIAAVLKKLNIVALKNVPPEVAAMFTQLATDAPLTQNGKTFLDALAALGANEAIPPELFHLIDDEKLAAFLAGLNALVTENRNESISVDADGMITILFQYGSENKTANTVMPSGVATPALIEAAAKELEYLKNNTITIADLDGDAFQNLKKLMFADIAPYLTAPRTVRVSDGTVMKIAQGPSFLNDEAIDATMLAAMAGLVPALPAQAVTPAVQGATPNSAVAPQDGAILMPAFLNADLLTQAQAQTPAVQKPLSHANFMAALLGISQPQAGTASEGGMAAPAQPAGDVLPIAAKGIVPAAVKAVPQISAQAAPVAEISTAATRGFETVMTGFDNFMMPADGAVEGLENGFRLHADQSSPGNSGTNLLAAKTAAQAHPSTHLVSLSLQRAVQNAMPFAAGAERQITIQMDPGNLGRVKITLQFGENNTLKAKMLAENPETLALLQKDAGILERALTQAGLDANRADMSFDLASGDSFSGSLRDEGQQNGHSRAKKDDGTEFAIQETVMSIFVDPETGLTHVNVVV